MTTYLYTLPDCSACESAKQLLDNSGEDYKEVPLNNPLVELGSQVLFTDGKVHAPIIVKPGIGIYMLNFGQLVLIRNLKNNVVING